MNILFTICGRAGSKGVKNKNLKMMCGKPLVYYTLSAIDLFIKQNNGKDTIHVCASSDSNELLHMITAQKKVPVFAIDRSAELSGDSIGKIAVIRDACVRSDNHFKLQHDMVIDLDITSPLRTVQDIINAYNKKRDLSDYDVIFSVTNARRNPYFNLVKAVSDSDEFQVVENCNFTSRQQAPQVFDMNASIYVYDGTFLRKSKTDKLFDGKCSAVVMKDTAILDIDSEDDFALMEYLCKYYIKIVAGIGEIYDNISILSGGHL